jgi:hypothetical protein
MLARGTRTALGVGFIMLAPRLASAQEEPSSADVSAARTLGQEGVKLADAGNCKEAIDKLARSEKLFHAPTTLERLGECQVMIGKVVEGSENLNKVVRETLAPNAPAAFTAAQERAKKILADAKPKIARLKIAVAGPAEGGYTVKLDGDVVPSANLNMNRPTDPGEHVVEASAPGYKTATAKVMLPEGGNDSIALTLEVDPNAPKPEPVSTQPAMNANPSSAPANPPPSTEPTSQPSRVPAYAALGVGVVGIGVGSIFGLMAIGKKGSVQDACDGSKCPSSVQDDIDAGKAFGVVSTVGFIVGGLGLVAGTYLYLTNTPKAGWNPNRQRTFVGANGLKLTF